MEIGYHSYLLQLKPGAGPFYFLTYSLEDKAPVCIGDQHIVPTHQTSTPSQLRDNDMPLVSGIFSGLWSCFKDCLPLEYICKYQTHNHTHVYLPVLDWIGPIEVSQIRYFTL